MRVELFGNFCYVLNLVCRKPGSWYDSRQAWQDEDLWVCFDPPTPKVGPAARVNESRAEGGEGKKEKGKEKWKE